MKDKFAKLVAITIGIAVAQTSIAQFDTIANRFHSASASYQRPTVGRTLPNEFIRNVEHNSPKSAPIKTVDFRGKWLVLDFWNKGCVACISSFPKMDSLASEFRDRVQFVLIGLEDKQGEIRSVYQKFKDRYKLSFTAAFDSTLMRKWGIASAPFIVVVDPNGMVRGITYKIERSDIRGFLEGRNPRLHVFYDYASNRLTSGRILSRSTIRDWDENTRRLFYRDAEMKRTDSGTFSFVAHGLPLYRLYNYGYAGRESWIASDSLYERFYRFPVSDDIDSEYINRILIDRDYSYILESSDKLSSAAVQEKLISDLDVNFGLESHVSVVPRPYWRLIVSDSATGSLRTKGGPDTLIVGAMHGFTIKNMPLKFLVLRLSAIMAADSRPIVDETGLSGNVDLDFLECNWADPVDRRRFLRKNGLDLVEGVRTFSCIVLRKKTMLVSIPKN